jgi:hypothetical protein
MQRMIGAEVADGRRMCAPQECDTHRGILNVDLASAARERAIGAAATQVAAAFARVVTLARQLLPWHLPAKAGDEGKRTPARGHACVNDARQQPVERKDERDNVSDHSVTQLEARFHAAIRPVTALLTLMGINTDAQFRAS